MEIKQIISPVRKLSELHFYQWYEDETMEVTKCEDIEYAIHNDEKLGYAQEWEGICPKLQEITFFDGAIVEKVESRWRRWGDL